MGMLKRRREFDFPLEPFLVYPGSHLWREHLDDDLPPELGLLGKEDARHAAASQFPVDPVDVAQPALQSRAQFAHVVHSSRSPTWSRTVADGR